MNLGTGGAWFGFYAPERLADYGKDRLTDGLREPPTDPICPRTSGYHSRMCFPLVSVERWRSAALVAGPMKRLVSRAASFIDPSTLL